MPLSDLGRSTMRILGLTMVLLGFGFASHYYFRFDISMTKQDSTFSGPTRVVNIGKAAERQAGITYWAFVSLPGVAAMYAGREGDPAESLSPAPKE